MTVALPILDEDEGEVTVVGRTACPEAHSADPADLARITEPPDSAHAPGDPFSPYKVLHHFDRLQRIVAGELVYPVTAEIDPSNRCGHRCQWCVSAQSHTGENVEADDFRDLVLELKQLGVCSVVLKGGGEPTIHPEINDLLGACAEVGLAVGLITNGSFPRPDTIPAILATTDWVRVSLDAASAETHRMIHGVSQFDRIANHVQQLARDAARTVIGLNFVAEPRNHHEIFAFTELARRWGADYVSIRCVFDAGVALSAEIRREMCRQAEAAKTLEDDGFRVLLGNFTDQYLDADGDQPFPFRKCLGPNLVGVIGADGEVYPCCFLRGRKDLSFGNVREQSFRQIWSGPRRQAAMEAVYRGACGHVCMGGMTSSRYNVYNEILNYLACEEKPHAEFV